ncbi:MAG: hypothetical protein H6726_13555 [Sandaracinaceae bacterium]|nr:hypothetical protein [Myxococcales bacterium]MCB9658670.1 hypothetical protein [Sandaracinaceae bacterium]
MRPWVRGWMVFVALASLAGCDGVPASNPDARVEREDLLLYPGACLEMRVTGVVQLEDLRVRSDSTVVSQALREERGGETSLTVCGRAVGSTRVDLLNGGAVVDSVFVEVLEVGLYLGAAQNNFPDEFPVVPGQVGLLVGRRALLYVVVAASDGRMFDVPFEDTFQPVFAPPVELRSVVGFLVEPMSPEAGVFPVRLVGENEERATELVVVLPEDIDHIEIAAIEDRNGNGSYSVTGVTADGLHILGLDAELTADGVLLDNTLGRWLFQGPSPSEVVSVVAEWNGLSASLP